MDYGKGEAMPKGMKLPKDCPRCGELMEECIAAEARQRNAWFCVKCTLLKQEFIKATGRERYIIKGAGNGRADDQ